jgi:hypothetical protein
VDADDGVGVIDRAREHPFELGGAEPGFERVEGSFDLGDDPGVVLRGAELEKDSGVVDVPDELFDALDLLLEAGALARDGLGFFGVVPEAGRQRLLLQAVDLGLEPRKVKDAPLAP